MVITDIRHFSHQVTAITNCKIHRFGGKEKSMWLLNNGDYKTFVIIKESIKEMTLRFASIVPMAIPDLLVDTCKNGYRYSIFFMPSYSKNKL